MPESMSAPEEPKPGRAKRPVGAPINAYAVTVDYGRTLREMIKAGKYDSADCPEINARNFRYRRGKGKVDIEIALLGFDQDILLSTALRQMNRMGYRAATLPELLALGETYPELQRPSPIIALGSVSRDRYRTRDRVPFLMWGNRRDIETIRFRCSWPPDWRFAAVAL